MTVTVFHSSLFVLIATPNFDSHDNNFQDCIILEAKRGTPKPCSSEASNSLKLPSHPRLQLLSWCSDIIVMYFSELCSCTFSCCTTTTPYKWHVYYHQWYTWMTNCHLIEVYTLITKHKLISAIMYGSHSLAQMISNLGNYGVNCKSNSYYEEDDCYSKEIDSKTCQEQWNPAVPFCLYVIAIVSEIIGLQIQQKLKVKAVPESWTMQIESHNNIITFFACLIAGMRHMSRNHSPLQQAITENTVGNTTIYLKCCFGDIFQATPTAAEESGFS